MTDETGSTGGDGFSVTELPADAPETFNSPNEAAAYFTSLKEKQAKEPAESADPVKDATANTESPSKEEDADPVKDPGEDATEADPVELPPIERPRSWAKDLDEEWASYPRAAQEKIVAREQERDAATRRSQNEAAEIRKAAEAVQKQAEEARKAYEAKLPALMESLQRQSEFADIRTMDDVKKLQLEDPFRFQQWQVYQMDAQAVDAERRQAEQRQQQERQSARNDYARAQDAKLQELIPEMKDPEKAAAIRTKAVNMLVDDYGFTEGELGAIMQTEDGFKLLSDARLQKLIADGLKYSEIRKAPAKAVPKDLPPVQRPGTSKPSGSTVSEKIQALEATFNRTGKLSDASALYAAQMEAQSRRRAS